MPFLHSQEKRLPSIDDLSKVNISSFPQTESIELGKNLEENSSEEENDGEEKNSPQTPPEPETKRVGQHSTSDTNSFHIKKPVTGTALSTSQRQGVNNSSAAF